MYMSEMIKERQNSEKAERNDLFSNLLAANDEDMDIMNLTESEIIGAFDSVLIELEIEVIQRKHLHFFDRWARGIST